MAQRSNVETGALAYPDGEQPLTLSRVISDFLTIIRFGLSGFITITGMILGPRAFTAALISVLIGWFTDIIDGPISRLRPESRKTLVSRLDLAADMSLVYSFLLFVVIAGLLPVWLALLYVVPGTAIAIKRPTETTLIIVSAPANGLPVVVSFAAGLPMGLCFVGFVLSAAVLRWKKLKQEAREAREEVEGATLETA